MNLRSTDKNYLVIAISGKAKSGKDTLSEFLQQSLINNFGQRHSSPIFTPSFSLSFAHKLKEICKEVYDLEDDHINTQDGKTTVLPNGKTTREILQHVGVAMREMDNDCWARIVVDKIEQELSSEKNCTDVPSLMTFFISDLRFVNEVEYLKKYIPSRHLAVIRIDRSGVNIGKLSRHISEIDLDDYNEWNYIVKNVGNIAILEAEANKIARNIEKTYL